MVRLTGGLWRGRRLEVPEGIRPTTELARKAAFDILSEAVRGARVLDSCAGSGAYGLEALSRGAKHATFVEADRMVARALSGNLERLGAGDASRVEVTSVERFASKDEEGRAGVSGADIAGAAAGPFGNRGVSLFDVVFHDPPFGANSQSDLQSLLALVRPAGWLFHERGDDEVYRPSGLEPADRRRYGTTRFLIFRP